MKKYLTPFLYLSFIFLLISLVKSDYLIVPKIHSSWKLFGSILFLFLGFIFDAIAWHKTINLYERKKIELTASISSVGLSIFGKYIPGKFWLILGRAGFLSKKYNLDEKNTALISLNAQFISLWTGLFLGGFGILLIGDAEKWGTLALLAWAIITFILFTRIPHKLAEKTISIILKKKIDIPSLEVSKIKKIAHWFFINWILWMVSFYLFVDALTATDIPYITGSIFAIAGTIGLLVLIAPGGIGIREGIMFAFLILCGLETAEATTISISSRLWFLSGEFFIFIIGYKSKKSLS